MISWPLTLYWLPSSSVSGQESQTQTSPFDMSGKSCGTVGHRERAGIEFSRDGVGGVGEALQLARVGPGPLRGEVVLGRVRLLRVDGGLRAGLQVVGCGDGSRRAGEEGRDQCAGRDHSSDDRAPDAPGGCRHVRRLSWVGTDAAAIARRRCAGCGCSRHPTDDASAVGEQVRDRPDRRRQPSGRESWCGARTRSELGAPSDGATIGVPRAGVAVPHCGAARSRVHRWVRGAWSDVFTCFASVRWTDRPSGARVGPRERGVVLPPAQEPMRRLTTLSSPIGDRVDIVRSHGNSPISGLLRMVAVPRRTFPEPKFANRFGAGSVASDSSSGACAPPDRTAATPHLRVRNPSQTDLLGGAPTTTEDHEPNTSTRRAAPRDADRSARDDGGERSSGRSPRSWRPPCSPRPS